MGECKKFWIVWGIGKKVPVFVHATHLAACEEAKRLALVSRDSVFVVMCAEKAYSVAPAPSFTETVYR